MKQANIRLSLSQGHDIGKKNVTPIEALILVSLHHANAGKNPVAVDEKTITDTTPDRTEDQELDRLRGIYGPSKIKNLLSEVKNLPKDFKEAIDRGTKLQLGSTGMISQTKLL